MDDSLSVQNCSAWEDFHFLIHSTPLWLSDGCFDFLESVKKELTQNPEPFKKHFEHEAEKLNGLRRLGIYYESLWRLYFEKSDCYDIVFHNYVLSEGGLTKGELDFILKERSSGKWLHFEVAVKFYLEVSIGKLTRCYGSNQQDRLDIKISRMKNLQLKRLVGKKLEGQSVTSSFGLIHGFVFTQSEVLGSKKWILASRLLGHERCYALSKKNWIRGDQNTEPIPYLGSDQADMLMIGSDERTSEYHQMFVVPEVWLNRLKEKLLS